MVFWHKSGLRMPSEFQEPEYYYWLRNYIFTAQTLYTLLLSFCNIILSAIIPAASWEAQVGKHKLHELDISWWVLSACFFICNQAKNTNTKTYQ